MSSSERLGAPAPMVLCLAGLFQTDFPTKGCFSISFAFKVPFMNRILSTLFLSLQYSDVDCME